MNEIKIILIILVMFLLTILASNQDSVQLKFFGLQTQSTSLTIFILGSVLLGAVFTGLVSYFSNKKLRKELVEKEKKIEELEEFKEAYEKDVREL